MTIERTDSEIIIKIPATLGMEEIQRLLDYLGYKAAASASKAKQEDINRLSRDVNKSWWENNKHKFLRP